MDLSVSLSMIFRFLPRKISGEQTRASGVNLKERNVYIMVADDLVMLGTRSSAAMMLTH